MLSAPTETKHEPIPWGSENELSSIACRAAIELDNFIVGRATSLKGVQKLAESIAASVRSAEEPVLNPTAVVVMNRAIHDSNWSSKPIASMDDLVKEAQLITSRLSRLAEQEQPSAADVDPVKLRLFCLTLSKLALASERSRMRTRPEHPFRR